MTVGRRRGRAGAPGRHRPRFVVLCGGRTGSTWVTTALDSHPDVGCFGELFERGHHRLRTPPHGRQDYVWFNTYLDEHAPGGAGKRAPRHWRRYLEGLYAPRPDVASIGFKLLYVQAREHPWVLPALAARRAVVIHLIRANPFAIVLSKTMADARGGSYHRSPGEDPDNPRVSIDTARLLGLVRREEINIRIGRAATAALGLPVIELRYESLLEDAPREFDRVLAFLGRAPLGASLQGSTRRLNEAPYADTIVNYDEVRRVLERSGRGALLAHWG